MGNVSPHETLIRGSPGAPLSDNGRHVRVSGSPGHKAADAFVRIVAGVRFQWVSESAKPKERLNARDVDGDVGHFRAEA